jgi:MFS family permease
MILPLALAQFIASYAATNMNVAISAIAEDLGTTVAGVQTAITLFTLTMAALMIPGSKLTDIWGRKRCFIIGLAVHPARSAGRPRSACRCWWWPGSSGSVARSVTRPGPGRSPRFDLTGRSCRHRDRHDLAAGPGTGTSGIWI